MCQMSHPPGGASLQGLGVSHQQGPPPGLGQAGEFRGACLEAEGAGKVIVTGREPGGRGWAGRWKGSGGWMLWPRPLPTPTVGGATSNRRGVGPLGPEPEAGGGAGSRCPRPSLCLLSSFEITLFLSVSVWGGSGLGGHVILGLSFPM